MNEIKILDTLPVILTKDSVWADDNVVAKEGAIIVLPEDAILVIPTKSKETK